MELNNLTLGIAPGVETVKEIYGVETISEMIPFVKIIAACRGMTEQMQIEVARPLAKETLAQLGLDPVGNEEHREIAKDYVDIVALVINDAMNLVVQHMHEQQMNAVNIRAGRPQLVQ